MVGSDLSGGVENKETLLFYDMNPYGINFIFNYQISLYTYTYVHKYTCTQTYKYTDRLTNTHTHICSANDSYNRRRIEF